MNKHGIPIIVLLILLFDCCIHSPKFNLPPVVIRNFPLVFSTNQLHYANTSVYCNYQLRAKTKGDTLLLNVMVINNSADSLMINPGNVQLISGLDIKSDVIDTGYHQYTIKPHSDTTLSFMFSPTHNRQLFETTGYKGDMDSIYYINSNFIATRANNPIFGDNKVWFKLNPKTYAAYKLAFALQSKIKLYDLTNAKQVSAALVKSLKERYINTFDQVRITKNIINVGGLTIKIAPYLFGDTIHLRLQVINYGRYEVKLNPNLFKLIVGNDYVFPKVLNAGNTFSFTKNGNYYVVTGGRFEAHLKYDLPAPKKLVIFCDHVWLTEKDDDPESQVKLNFSQD